MINVTFHKSRLRTRIREEVYYDALREMLNREYPCVIDNCPAYILNMACGRDDELNSFCKRFVGLEPEDDCPCMSLGEEEALRRATENLIKLGY